MTATLNRTTPTIEYFENDLFIVDPANIRPYSQDWLEKSKYLDKLFAQKKLERQQSNEYLFRW